MASNIRCIPILLGMGFQKLSVGINRIPEVKNLISKIDIVKAKRLANKSLKSVDIKKIEKMTKRFLRKMERTHIEKMVERRITGNC